MFGKEERHPVLRLGPKDNNQGRRGCSKSLEGDRTAEDRQQHLMKVIDSEQSLEGKLEKAEQNYETARTEMTTEYDNEREASRVELNRLKLELEGQVFQRQEEVEDVLTRERESWKAERELLLQRWQDERESLLHTMEKRCSDLTQEYKISQEELQRSVVGLQAELTAANEERIATGRAKDRLKQRWDEDRVKFEKAIAELSGVADTLGKEKGKLQKMVEAFGEVTDVKPKGDTF